MFKEHNLNMKQIGNYKAFLVCVLSYFLFLNMIIEQSVNTSLIVSSQPEYYDTIDQIAPLKRRVHFMKGHYTLGKKQIKSVQN